MLDLDDARRGPEPADPRTQPRTSFTGALGTPASARTASHSAVVRSAKAASRIGEQLVAVAVARGEVREALVGSRARAGRAPRRALPELLLRAGDDDPAVGRREVLERHDRRVRRVAPPRRRVARASPPTCRRSRARAAPSRRARRRSRSRRRRAARATRRRAPRSPRRSRPRGRRARGRSSSAGRRGRRSGSSSPRVPASCSRSRPPLRAARSCRSRRASSRRSAGSRRFSVVVGEAEAPRLVAAQVRVDDVGVAHEVLEHTARAVGRRRSSETLLLLRLNVSKKSESSPSANGGT